MSQNPKVMPRPGSAFAGSRSSIKMGTWKPPQVDTPHSPTTGTRRNNQLTPLRGAGGLGGAGGTGLRSKSPISLNKSRSTVNLHASPATQATPASAQGVPRVNTASSSSTAARRKPRASAGMTVYDFRNTVSLGALPSRQAAAQAEAAVQAAAAAATAATAPGNQSTGPKFFKLQGNAASARPMSFRSDALNLEVALQERLKRLDMAAAGGDVVASLSVERFRVFSHLFDAIIEKDRSFGGLLQRVKDEYERCMKEGSNPRVTESPDYARLVSSVQLLQQQVSDLQETNAALEDENYRLQDAAGTPAAYERLSRENSKLRAAVESLRARCDRLEDGRMGARDGASPPARGFGDEQNSRRAESARSFEDGFSLSGSSCMSLGLAPTPLPQHPRPNIPQLQLAKVVTHIEDDETTYPSAFTDGDQDDEAGNADDEGARGSSGSGSSMGSGSGSDSDGDSEYSDGAMQPQVVHNAARPGLGIPALQLGAVKAANVQGYHDEFLSHKLDFSESWREAAEEMNRTGAGAEAQPASGRGGGTPVNASAAGGGGVARLPTSPMGHGAGDGGGAGGGGGGSGGGSSVRDDEQSRRRGGADHDAPALMDADEEVGARVDSETEALMKETRLHLAL